MEPTRPAHSPWVEIAKENDIKWTPTYKTSEIQLGGERIFPPDSCFEKDTRKTIVRGGYVLIFNIWRNQDFIDLRKGSIEILLRRASSIKR